MSPVDTGENVNISMNNYMIKIIDLKKKFKTDFWSKNFYALDGLSFEIPAGEIIGFLGANGAGKTTLMKLILGFIQPSSGEILYSKELGENRKEIFSKIGLLPERPYFYPSLTGREFIRYLAELNGMLTQEIKVKTANWSERLGIAAALDRKINTYSKGMLQRLGLITALIHGPKLVILDEPLSGLDPIGRKEFKEILVAANQEGKTIFFSGHVVSDVEEICRQVIFIEKGKLVYSGSINKLIEQNVNTNYQIKFFIPHTSSLNQSNSSATFRGSENGPFPLEITAGQGKFLYTGEDGMYVYEVFEESKDEFLTNILKFKAKIISVERTKVGLEEILYRVRPQ